MRLVRLVLAILAISATLTQAHAETRSEYLHRIAKANGEMKARQHEINMERKKGKISREQQKKEMSATIQKDKEAHRMQ